MMSIEEADQETLLDLTRPRPIAEYHEDMGNVLWWKFPIVEPPYVGSPNDMGREILALVTVTQLTGREDKPTKEDQFYKRIYVGGWPGYHTHFTPIPIPKEPAPCAADG